MSKRHEYSETEWGFPEVWDTPECGEFYDAEYVQDWIRRCMEDVPVIPARELDHKKEFGRLSDWFDKWFSQFTTNSEES